MADFRTQARYLKPMVQSWVTGSHFHHPLVHSGRVEQWVAPLKNHRIDLQVVVSELADRRINEVLVEAGPRLVGQCITEELVDHGVLYLAPNSLGRPHDPLYDVAPYNWLMRRRFLFRRSGKWAKISDWIGH